MLIIQTNGSQEDLTPIKFDGEYQTVVVFLSHVRQPVKRNFRCHNCGRIVFQYLDSVVSVVDSPDTPLTAPTIEFKCGRCGILYKVV